MTASTFKFSVDIHHPLSILERPIATVSSIGPSVKNKNSFIRNYDTRVTISITIAPIQDVDTKLHTTYLNASFCCFGVKA